MTSPGPDAPLDEGTPTQLVSSATYTMFTGDSTSSGIDAALQEAQLLCEEATRRTWAQGTYTETLGVYPNGRIYPSALPIESVSSPDGAIINGHAIIVSTLTAWPGTFPLNLGQTPPLATVTYVGGWTAATIPHTLRRIVSSAAWRLLHPTALAGLPPGVNSAHIGDASVSGRASLSAFDLLDTAARRDLSRYQRRKFLA